MKKIVLIYLAVLIINAPIFSQQYEWTKTFGSKKADIGLFSVIDKEGNIYLTGFFQDSIDFNGEVEVSKGSMDICIVKYSPNGDILWHKVYGGSDIDRGASIALDNVGNVYVTGDFRSQHVDFGDSSASDISSKGQEDIFLIKLNKDGEFIWFQRYGANAKDAGISLHFDNLNNLLLTGFFALQVDFNPGGSGGELESAGFIDALVLKLDTDGNYIWARAFRGTEYVKGLFINSDIYNNVYVSGYFYGTADFDPSNAEIHNETSNGERDFYVTKLNSDGDFVWAGSIGGIVDDRAISIAIDKQNNLYFTGFFGFEADFDMSEEEYVLSASDTSDIFVFKINDAGDLMWAKQIGGVGFDEAREVVVDNDGNLLLTGQFEETVDFNPGLEEVNFTSSGRKDVFLLKLDADGKYIWNKKIGGKFDDYSYALSIDKANNIYILGTFTGRADFDFGADKDILKSNGARDVFLTKILDNTTTNIVNDVLDNKFQLFPNPAINNISLAGTNKLTAIEIRDINGRLVLEKIIDDNQIDISSFRKGVYFVTIKTENTQVIKKIIKL